MARFIRKVKGETKRDRALMERLRIAEDIARNRPLINLTTQPTAGRPSAKHPRWKVRGRTALENATIYRKWLEEGRTVSQPQYSDISEDSESGSDLEGEEVQFIDVSDEEEENSKTEDGQQHQPQQQPHFSSPKQTADHEGSQDKARDDEKSVGSTPDKCKCPNSGKGQKRKHSWTGVQQDKEV